MSESPHDALFKAAFSHPGRAAEALRHALAPELAALVDWPSLGVRPGSFVDKDLREHHTDLLYEADIAGRRACIYVLFEHQSRADRWMPVRLLRYMLCVWEQLLAEDPARERLPPIVPVVLHHSATGWRRATGFHALLPADTPAPLLACTPGFSFSLDDLSHVPPGDLLRRAASASTRLVLSALQQGRTAPHARELLAMWAGALRELEREPGGHGALQLVFKYLFDVRGGDEFAAIDAAAVELGKTQEATMQTISEMLEERGLKKGLERGRQEGRQEGRREGQDSGQRELLLRLLASRFGDVPAELRARVAAADGAQVAGWAERLLVAASLQDVFAGG